MSKEIEIELNIGGIDLTVSGEYYPEEPKEMYDGNMEGYPGYPAEFNINSIQINSTDITDIVSDDVFDEIREKVIEKLKE